MVVAWVFLVTGTTQQDSLLYNLVFFLCENKNLPIKLFAISNTTMIIVKPKRKKKTKQWEMES